MSTTPPDGAVDVPIEISVDAVFSLEMDPASFTTASFVLERISPTPNQVAGSVQYDAVSHTVRFVSTDPFADSAEYRATLADSIRDTEGRAFGPVTWTFKTVDLQSPTLVNLLPACGSENIPPEGLSVSAFFSEAIDSESLHSNFFVRYLGQKNGGAGGGINPNTALPGSLIISEDRRAAQFVPERPFRADAIFRIVFEEGIQDDSGNELEPFACEFDTAERVRPTMVASFPAANAINVPINTNPIWARFSEALDQALINQDSLIMTDIAGNRIDGTVTYDEVLFRLNFQVAASLVNDMLYTVTIANIRDLSGNLTDPHPISWRFQTVSPWELPVSVEGTPDNFPEDAKNLILARNRANGNVYVAWEQKRASDNTVHLYVRHRTPAGGWQGTATRVSHIPSGTATEDVAEARFGVIPGTGTVDLVWTQKFQADAHRNVYHSRLTGGSGSWTAPLRVSTNASPAESPAVGRFGTTAFAVWSEQVSGDVHRNIHTNRKADSDASWLPSNRIRLSNDASEASFPDITVAIQNAYPINVLWVQTDPTNLDTESCLYARTSTPGDPTIWSLTERASQQNANILGRPALVSFTAGPAFGSALAVWTQQGATHGDMHRSVYSSRWNYVHPTGGVWEGAERLSANVSEASDPSASFDSESNDVLLAWSSKANGDSFENIHASTSFFNTQPPNGNPRWMWTPSTRVTDDRSDCTKPSVDIVRVSPTSRPAFVSWRQKDPDMDSVFNAYSSKAPSALGAWDNKLHVSDNVRDGETPWIAAYLSATQHHAVVVWLEKQASGENRNVMGSRLVQNN